MRTTVRKQAVSLVSRSCLRASDGKIVAESRSSKVAKAAPKTPPLRTAKTSAASKLSDASKGEMVAKKAASAKVKARILSAPKGIRTLTPREVKLAVGRVFAKRHGANA